MKLKSKWDPIINNEIRRFKGGYFSYNPMTNAGEETAIHIYQDNKWLILQGDYREKLEELMNDGGIEACIQFFNDSPNQHSLWSD